MLRSHVYPAIVAPVCVLMQCAFKNLRVNDTKPAPTLCTTRSRVVHSVGAKRTHEPVGGRAPFGLIKVLKAGPEPKALDRYTVTSYRVVTR